MRKVIAAINTSINGNCNHEAGIADEDLHRHYTQLLNEGSCILYDRTTFQLMQFWQSFLKQASDNAAHNAFAHAIGQIPKIVFSYILNQTGWDTTQIAHTTLENTISGLKLVDGKPIYIGSRSLINQALAQGLVDELQLCIQPVITGKGLYLFEENLHHTHWNLIDTKIFQNGSIIFYYQPQIVY